MYRTVPVQESGVDATESLRAMHGWARCVLLLLLGSMFGRAFYYLGFPPAHIFIGEIVLALAFLFCTRQICDPWFSFLVRPGIFSPFAWCLLLSILYGIAQTIYGVFAGHSPLTAFENLAFNVYPIYLFLGLWVGADYPTLLRKVIRGWAWILMLYGPLYLLFLHRLQTTMPGSDTPLFSQPGGGGLIALSLLALESRPWRFWVPITIAVMMMLVIQVRAEWLGAILGFAVWAILERKISKVLPVAALAVTLLIIGFAVEVSIPSPQVRGGTISSAEIVARGVSAVSPELAQDLTGSRNVGFYYGTVRWRARWWTAIWNSVNDSTTRQLIGHGYGFRLGSLVPYLNNSEIRTPHNIFFFVLGYSGWIGTALFLAAQASLFAILWRCYRLTRQAWGLAFFAASLGSAFVGNSLEAPMGAISYYLILGIVIGSVLGRNQAPKSASYVRPGVGRTLAPKFEAILPAKAPAEIA